MDRAGQIVAKIFEQISSMVKVGTNINMIDQKVAYLINKYQCISAPIEKGFPSCCCISVNDVVCHGVVNDYLLKSGDVVSIDISLQHNKLYSDSCVTFIIEPVTIRHKKLVETAYEALWKSIEYVKPGVYTGDIGHICESYAKRFGFKVVEEFAGHGIGRELHMEPQIPFFGTPGTGKKLKKGMYITIEPMLTEGSSKIYIESDGWTARTIDSKYSAQFEHTLEITDNGCNVLTYNFFDKLHNKKQTIS